MNQLQEYLMRLGLTKYQAQAMEVLFEGNTLTAKEISTETKIPYTKVYNELEQLERLGIVRTTMDTPRLYHALKPETVFDSLLEQQKTRTKELETVKKSVLDDVLVNWKDGEEKEFESKIWAYHSNAAVWEGVVELVKNSKKHIRGIGSQNTLQQAWSSESVIKTFLEACEEKNVKTEKIYSTNLSGKDIVSSFATAGFPVRKVGKFMKLLKSPNYIIRTLPEHLIQNEFVIADKEVFEIAFRNKTGVVERGIKVQDKNFTSFMINHFDTLWEQTEPLGAEWFLGLKK